MSRVQFAVLIVVLIAIAVYLHPAPQYIPPDYGGCVATVDHPCIPIYHGD